MKRWEIIIISLCLIIFSIICFLVCNYEVLDIDMLLYNYVNLHIRGDFFTSLFSLITYFGGFFFIFLMALLIFIFSKKYRWFITLDIAFCSLLNYFIKLLVLRPRPINSLISENGYSFPSGHTMISVAFYGIIIYLIFKNVKTKYLRYSLSFILLLFIFLIAFSRIYLSVHYFTDVLSALLLGLAYLIVYINIYKGVTHT